jgi:hypothetical protein
MTQPAKSQEPSMEEILASIRRIIADDDAGKTPEPPAAAAAPAVAAPPLRPVPPPRPQPPVLPTATPESSVTSFKSPSGMAADAARPSRASVSDQSADILDLTESMAAPPPPPGGSSQFRTIDGNFDVGYEEAAEKQASRGGDSHPSQGNAQLLSRQTTAAVDSAFNSLAQTVLVQNARTLEDLVREMLRPLLKSWLDDNLPGMVERIVRSEIERVSRGRPV